jgi:hypothetical protein
MPIKLEFITSVGFVRKESVTMHGHTIFKKYPVEVLDLLSASQVTETSWHSLIQIRHRMGNEYITDGLGIIIQVLKFNFSKLHSVQFEYLAARKSQNH